MPSKKRSLLAASGAGGDSLYVEDVFSTYLYDGTSADGNQIVNGIDLLGEGGVVWIKGRDSAYTNLLFTSDLTADNYYMQSNGTNGESSAGDDFVGFNSDGFTLDAPYSLSASAINGSAYKFVSWSFRKAEKFFDVVTYTGTGVARTIAHNLGSVPGCMIIKRTDLGSANWYVYHIGIGTPQGYEILLNTTANADTNSNVWNNTAPTDSVFSIGAGGSPYDWNASGGTYIAYLFASDAGGFGDDEDESIIKCGSYTGNGSSDGPDINLGFEAQWVMIKRTDASGNDWVMMDIMRGMPMDSGGAYLRANLANAEAATAYMQPTPTGLKVRGTGSTQANANGATYIYIAIRRPMKTPESGTEVFSPNIWTGSGSPEVITTGFSPDVSLGINRGAVHASTYLSSRLMGMDRYLSTTTTAAENSDTASVLSMDGITINSGNLTSGFGGGQTYVGEFFKRATGFMDVVCYSGTGSLGNTLTHNLGVVPELMIVKCRSNNPTNWTVYTAATGNTSALYLNDSGSVFSGDINYWNNTSPTATQFTVGLYGTVNASTYTYIAYLFATLDGVSKVGSYTGTGADLNVDCGFTAGARFILIKRTDSTGDWYTYDSVSGISAGNDPYLLLNTTSAEVTGTDYIDPLSSGFTVTSTAPAGLNANGGTYIFLAIA